MKLACKGAAVYPLARRWAGPHAMFATLLMSTGLTFGTISATYGFTAGIITRAQFSVLICVVVGLGGGADRDRAAAVRAAHRRGPRAGRTA